MEEKKFILLLISMLLVLVAMFFIAYILKKKNILKKNNYIDEVERFYYNPKTFLSLIEVGDKILLLGVSEDGINNICDIGKDKLKNGFNLKEAKKNKNQSNDFQDVLNDKSGNFEDLKDRLRKMRHN